MSRINLLPWREEQRRERQRQFLLTLGMAFVAAVVVVLVWNTFEANRISVQNSRNQTLQAEIREMDTRIEEIARLELIRNNLLERKQVIESLQGERSATVMMLDELVMTTPVGVTLKGLRQQGTVVTLTGTTQSNARVSAYLASLEDSELFVNPKLQIIQSGPDRENSVEPYDFSITVAIPRKDIVTDEFGEEITDDA
jgi:type IV pilus assembly protein PilN